MKKPIDNYFTTGELAKLCKIPRKTLLYYDSLGLITPEVIEENGYRYYKRTQLFALELILSFKSRFSIVKVLFCSCRLLFCFI